MLVVYEYTIIIIVLSNEQEPLERKLGETELAPGQKAQDFVYEIPLILSLEQFLSD